MPNQWQWFAIAGVFSILSVQPVFADGTKAQRDEATRRIRQLSEIERPFTSADLLVQAPTPSSPPTNNVIEVTGVKANPTDKGVEVILQSTVRQKLQVVNRSAGNSYIADIPNAQLRLPSGDTFVFRSEKPLRELLK